MRCWNCDTGLPARHTLCPNCRAALPPEKARLPEVILLAVVLFAAGVGYAGGGWLGVVTGVFAGVPLGMVALAVWHERA